MSRIILLTLASIVLPVSFALAKGDGTLQGPLTITTGRPGPVTVHTGDFNGDGKLDIVSANGVASNEATGSPSIYILLQNPSNRLDWQVQTLRIGSSAVFVRGADFDNDGFDDIMVGDVAQYAFYVHSKGDGTFDPPVKITQANGARWVTVGDFNNDDKLDFACSNFRSSNLTIFLGDGAGNFTLSSKFSGSREHTLEALDFDGDGKMDLMQGSGLPGITPYKNLGLVDGVLKFQARPNVSNLGCIEYIAEAGTYKFNKATQKLEYTLIGDLNHDGKADLAVTCIDDQNAYVGVSLGTGQYKKVLQFAGGGRTESTAFADLNQDGHIDVAMVSNDSSNLWVFLGKGDGTFQGDGKAPEPDPIIFGPTGTYPAFLVSQDLDGDGYFDVISGEQTSVSVTIFWGKAGERFLESGYSLTGFAGAKTMALADADKDGVLDLILPRSDQLLVNYYLKPGQGPATKPSFNIPVEKKYTLLETADLDADGFPDLIGADAVGGTAQVAIIDPVARTPRSQLSFTAGVSPSYVELGQVDGSAPLDFLVACKGSNHVAIFLGQGGGAFGEAKLLPTVEKPKATALRDLDDDTFQDLLVLGDTAAVVHYGKGGGEFAEPADVVRDTTKIYTHAAIGDVVGDTALDLVVTEQKTTSVYIFPGKGDRLFEVPIAIKLTAAPTTVVLADMNEDGLLDLTLSSLSSRSAFILLNQGQGNFAKAAVYGLGVTPQRHRIADLNGDGILDVIGFMATQATVLLGRSEAAPIDGKFRRGDANANGQLEITDPIMILLRLFLGGEAIPCEDAADADNDGAVGMNDAVLVLLRLFAGGDPLPPPGPGGCGEDPDQVPDQLTCNAPCI
ncbi:MAG: VCBS repeat-containing protein [Planctomycetes bacterium]|nr:VCBS repeat-containing protein [Planctomycetota bacterium]